MSNITLGIIGVGQLGSMLAIAAKKLNIKTLGPTTGSSAALFIESPNGDTSIRIGHSATTTGFEIKYKGEFWEWERKKKDNVYKKEKERKVLHQKIEDEKRQLPGIIYSLVDKKFILFKLKEKSNIQLYIDIYTGCERLYNKTPSAFLLEWNK